jgi:protein-tyrosine phosphatase
VDVVSDVLFVCTGNLCRSPSAAALFQRQVTQAQTPGITVTSAGTLQATGRPPSGLVEAARVHGIELAAHLPRRMTPEDLARADLIIGMTREHLREVVVLDRTTFGRTFTLREIVRRGEAVGARAEGQALDDWLTGVHGGRRHADLVGQSSPDDIADPMGGPAEGYRAMLAEVVVLTEALRRLAWGASQPGTRTTE